MAGGRTRHVPTRRCAACRSVLPQEQLIRFARDDEGMWQLDLLRRKGGRGTWICGDPQCHDRKTLGRAFRAQAPQVADQLAALDALRVDRHHEERSRTEG